MVQVVQVTNVDGVIRVVRVVSVVQVVHVVKVVWVVKVVSLDDMHSESRRHSSFATCFMWKSFHLRQNFSEWSITQFATKLENLREASNII